MFSSFDIASIINWFLEMPEMQVYLWVMLLMTIESSFIPFPSEIVVPPAAYLAANQRADIWLVLLFATIGAALGAIFNYAISWWLGRPIVYRFADSQLGHMCLINREKVEKAEKYLRSTVLWPPSSAVLCPLSASSSPFRPVCPKCTSANSCSTPF